MVKRTPLAAFATVRGTLTAIKLRVRITSLLPPLAYQEPDLFDS